MNNLKDSSNQIRAWIKEVSTAVLLSIQEMLNERKNNVFLNEKLLLQEDLGLTSLAMISLITDLCDDLEIDITKLSDVDLVRMKRVEDLIIILSSKKD